MLPLLTRSRALRLSEPHITSPSRRWVGLGQAQILDLDRQGRPIKPRLTCNQIAKGRYRFDMGTTGVERFQLHLLVPR